MNPSLSSVPSPGRGRSRNAREMNGVPRDGIHKGGADRVPNPAPEAPMSTEEALKELDL